VRIIDGPFPTQTLVQVSRFPRLYLMDGFVNAAEIEAIKAIGDSADALQAIGLEVTRGDAGCAVDLPALDDTLADVGARIEALAGRADRLDDSLRFRRYQIGEFHRRHTDAVYPVDGLHLVLTALVCLDEPRAGGETLFPYADGGPLAVRHRAGRLVMWCSYTAEGCVDQSAIHEGLPVLAGTKATIGKFLHRGIEDAGLELAAAEAR
jgi:hypothetical protein